MGQKQDYCEHEHPHVYLHIHEHPHDGVTHTHEQEHVHSHSHVHGGEQDTLEEITVLLSYMTDHNRHHAEELADMGGRIRSMGMEDAADLIAEGVKEFARANGLFAEALKQVKQVKKEA